MIDRLTTGHIVVYDLEWTSWDGFLESGWGQPNRYREIIQIGAVRLDVANDFAEVDAFETFVKPRINPRLSEYIIALTQITQSNIDTKGISFPKALERFLAFLGPNSDVLFSFGRDNSAIKENCRLNDMAMPEIFYEEHDLRHFLVNRNLIDTTCCSSDVPSQIGFENTEISHNALGDARALAAALRHLRATGQI